MCGVKVVQEWPKMFSTANDPTWIILFLTNKMRLSFPTWSCQWRWQALQEAAAHQWGNAQFAHGQDLSWNDVHSITEIPKYWNHPKRYQKKKKIVFFLLCSLKMFTLSLCSSNPWKSRSVWSDQVSKTIVDGIKIEKKEYWWKKWMVYLISVNSKPYHSWVSTSYSHIRKPTESLGTSSSLCSLRVFLVFLYLYFHYF